MKQRKWSRPLRREKWFRKNWRIVPHHPDVIIEQEDLAEFLYPHTRWRWTIDLTDYYLPESGLFRYVIGIAVGHTVFDDFSVKGMCHGVTNVQDIKINIFLDC